MIKQSYYGVFKICPWVALGPNLVVLLQLFLIFMFQADGFKVTG